MHILLGLEVGELIMDETAETNIEPQNEEKPVEKTKFTGSENWDEVTEKNHQKKPLGLSIKKNVSHQFWHIPLKKRYQHGQKIKNSKIV